MALQPCPLVGAFLHEVGLVMSTKPDFFRDLFDELDELKGLASENYPNDSALNLRGLYVLEVIYSELLPQSATSVSFISEEVKEGMRQRRFPRSVEGMQAIIGYLSELKEDTEVADYAAELAGLGVAGLREWGRGQRSHWEYAVTSALFFANQLKSALRGVASDLGVTWVDWDRMGTQFAMVCTRTHLPIERCFSHARVLLSINLQNGPSPWNLTKSYPE